jgi:hypothetical protein
MAVRTKNDLAKGHKRADEALSASEAFIGKILRGEATNMRIDILMTSRPYTPPTLGASCLTSDGLLPVNNEHHGCGNQFPRGTQQPSTAGF